MTVEEVESWTYYPMLCRSAGDPDHAKTCKCISKLKEAELKYDAGTLDEEIAAFMRAQKANGA